MQLKSASSVMSVNVNWWEMHAVNVDRRGDLTELV